MKSSFRKNATTVDAPEAGQEQSGNNRTLATQPNRGSLATPVQHKGKNDMFGQWLPKDSKLPRLNIVQKSSGVELVKAFDLGDLVLAKNVKLADEKNPVRVVALIAGKDYQQKTPFGEGQGVVYATEEEVLNNGGTTTYTKQNVQDQIYFGPRAHIQFAIQAPEGLTEQDLNFFPFEHNGAKWALGIMTVASSAFTSLAKELETLRQYNKIMMQGLIYGQLELVTAFKQKPGQEWYVPIAKLLGETSQADRDFFTSIAGLSPE